MLANAERICFSWGHELKGGTIATLLTSHSFFSASRSREINRREILRFVTVCPPTLYYYLSQEPSHKANVTRHKSLAWGSSRPLCFSPLMIEHLEVVCSSSHLPILSKRKDKISWETRDCMQQRLMTTSEHRGEGDMSERDDGIKWCGWKGKFYHDRKARGTREFEMLKNRRRSGI